jgi:hypothetical protein
MELKGKVVKLLPLQKGTSSRGEWRKQEFIIEVPGNFPKQVCLYMWGDAIDNNPLVEGDDINASIEIESREYNGRWYTNVKAWRIEKEKIEAESPSGASISNGPAPASPFSEPRLVDLSTDEDDGLPF